MFRERFDQLDDALDDFQDVDGPLVDVPAPGPQPGQIQYVVDEGLHVPAAGDDALHVLVQLRWQWFELQQLGEAQHRVERGAQFVAEPCDELVCGPGLPFGRLPGTDVLGVIRDDHYCAGRVDPYRHQIRRQVARGVNEVDASAPLPGVGQRPRHDVAQPDL